MDEKATDCISEPEQRGHNRQRHVCDVIKFYHCCEIFNVITRLSPHVFDAMVAEYAFNGHRLTAGVFNVSIASGDEGGTGFNAQNRHDFLADGGSFVERCAIERLAE